jgi:hypothetical protein
VATLEQIGYLKSLVESAAQKRVVWVDLRRPGVQLFDIRGKNYTTHLTIGT